MNRQETKPDFKKMFMECFFEEASELSGFLIEGLMNLRIHPEDRLLLDRICTSSHSITGAAEQVGLQNIADFASKIKTILFKIKKEELPTDAKTLNTVLDACSKLHHLVADESLTYQLEQLISTTPTDTADRN